jgi:uncharacterized coiled-coil protein SlyX
MDLDKWEALTRRVVALEGRLEFMEKLLREVVWVAIQGSAGARLSLQEQVSLIRQAGAAPDAHQQQIDKISKALAGLLEAVKLSGQSDG